MLTAHLIENVDAMPPQLQAAARYILDHLDDVALLSMREQARRAGVQPWTMTRLAQRLGLAGYDDVRALYATAVREGVLGFAWKAGSQMESQKERGDRGLALDIISATQTQIAQLAHSSTLDTLAAAAGLLASAERIYCLGLRSCHPVAAQFAYVMSFLGERAVLLDAAAGPGWTPSGAPRLRTLCWQRASLRIRGRRSRRLGTSMREAYRWSRSQTA